MHSFLLFIFISISTNLTAQQDNSQFTETIFKEIKEKKGGTLSFASGKINHIYEISILNRSEITEFDIAYVINPVEATMAIKINNFTLEKAKFIYKVTIYKEFKGLHASFMKTDMITIWNTRKETKELSKFLKI